MISKTNSILQQMKARNHISKMEYLMMFLFIVCCGFTAADLIPAKSYFIIIVGIYYVISGQRQIREAPKALMIIITFMLLATLMHKIQFGVIDIVLLKYIPLSIAGYFLVVALGRKFPEAYLNVMTFLAAVSLVCYALMLAGYVVDVAVLRGSKESMYKGVFFWNARYNEIIQARNCGPFWEPGAFSGYILMVFVLYFGKWGYLWREHSSKVIILVLALITTFASQGYLVAFMLLLIRQFLNAKKKDVGLIYVAGFVMLFAISLLYQTLPFLKEKVDEQLELTEYWDDDASLRSANRFTTTMVDIENIKRNPLWGLTSDPYILYKDYNTIMFTVQNGGGYGSGSGSSNYIASNGLVLFAVWLLLCYHSLMRFYASKRRAVLLLLVLLILGQAEMYNSYIFYHTIPFLGFIKPK